MCTQLCCCTQEHKKALALRVLHKSLDDAILSIIISKEWAQPDCAHDTNVKSYIYVIKLFDFTVIAVLWAA